MVRVEHVTLGPSVEVKSLGQNKEQSRNNNDVEGKEFFYAALCFMKCIVLDAKTLLIVFFLFVLCALCCFFIIDKRDKREELQLFDRNANMGRNDFLFGESKPCEPH